MYTATNSKKPLHTGAPDIGIHLRVHTVTHKYV